MSEHDQQVTLFQLIELDARRWPELELLFAIPNAGAGGQPGRAGKMSAEGVKPGVPDICLPVARGSYHGLYIEMKEPGREPSDVQRKYIARLKAEGYLVEVCYGCDSARVVLLSYTQLPSTKVVTEEVWRWLHEHPPS